MSKQVWAAPPIEHDGLTLEVSATADFVDLGKTVNGVYASDVLLPADKARTYATAIWQGANASDKAKQP